MPDYPEPPAEIRSFDPLEHHMTPARRFRQHRRVANVGLVSMLGGGLAFSASAGLLVIHGISRDPPPLQPGTQALLFTGIIGGGAAYVGGQGLVTYGGIAAAYDVRRAGSSVSPAYAIVGAGLSVSGALVGMDGARANFSLPASLAGPALTFFQLVADDVAARRHGLTQVSFGPTPNGFHVAGTW